MHGQLTDSRFTINRNVFFVLFIKNHKASFPSHQLSIPSTNITSCTLFCALFRGSRHVHAIAATQPTHAPFYKMIELKSETKRTEATRIAQQNIFPPVSPSLLDFAPDGRLHGLAGKTYFLADGTCARSRALHHFLLLFLKFG